MAEPDSESLPPAYLFLEDGDRIFRVHLDGPKLRLGSSEKSDVVIKSAEVEIEHAQIAFHAPHFVLSSSSQAPPSVNGKPLEGPRRLYNGDVVNLAGHIMTFVKRPAVSDTVIQLALWGAGEEPYFLLLNRPEFSLGYSDSDLRIADEFLGSPHCAIENFCAGVQFVVPIDEDRGVFIDGKRIRRRTRLQDGDVLTMGSTEVAVRLHPRRSLPSPTEAIPFDDVSRARLAADYQEGDGELSGADRGPSEARRSVREILRDADASSGRQVAMTDGFEDEEDSLYYLPEGADGSRMVPVDGRIDEEAGDGHTMVLQVDGKGKAKRERYYLPDGEEADVVRERAVQMEREGSRQTRYDLEVASGGDDDEGDDD